MFIGRKDKRMSRALAGRPVRLLVALPIDLGERDLQRITSAAGPDSVVEVGAGGSPGAVAQALAENPATDVLFCAHPPAEIPTAGALRWIQFSGAGIDAVRSTRVWEHPEIAVTTSAGIHAAAVCDWILLAMLARSRRLSSILRFRETRQWPDADTAGQYVARPLAGRTVAVLGHGHIGSEIGRRASALGMTVVSVDHTDPVHRSSVPVDHFAGTRALGSDGVPDPVLPLPQALALCDYLVVTVPLTSATQGLIGRQQLALLRPDAALINVARGQVVDEAALVEHLRGHPEAYAALDVFASEPLDPSSPLFDLDNCLLSPHVAGAFEGYWPAAVELFRVNLRRFVAAEPLKNLVRRDAGY